MQTKFIKKNYSSEPKPMKIEYVSLSANDEEIEKKYTKKGKLNSIVLGSFISMLVLCLVLYLIFYCKPVKAIFGLLAIAACFYLFFKLLKKDYYNQTVDTFRNIKSLIKKKAYKEDTNVEDRLYYSMNI